MRITMVKKRLASGEPCKKCVQTEEMLNARGLWHRIDEVVWAVENEPHSPGMRMSERLGVDLAPFFVVTEDDGTETVYKSVLKLVKERLVEPAAAPPAAAAATDGVDVAAAAEALAEQAPPDILRWGLERFGDRCAIAFSGAEDVVLIDMASKLGLPFSVFTLDTGRLHPETYRFIERVRSHYGISIEMVVPDAPALEAFVRQKGLFSFYEEGHEECCGIRKVAPLRRALSRCCAWVTGQRRDQSPATRSQVPVLQHDGAFTGLEGGALLKLNPLARRTLAETWAYIREHEVPYNELHDRGFVSIGCEPCTRAVRPGEHERAGRWWWEESTQRECGLHVPKRG